MEKQGMESGPLEIEENPEYLDLVAPPDSLGSAPDRSGLVGDRSE